MRQVGKQVLALIKYERWDHGHGYDSIGKIQNWNKKPMVSTFLRFDI